MRASGMSRGKVGSFSSESTPAHSDSTALRLGRLAEDAGLGHADHRVVDVGGIADGIRPDPDVLVRQVPPQQRNR